MDRPLVEVYPVADIFASGIAKVERLGNSLVRIVLYADASDELGKPIRRVVAKLVRPVEGLLSVQEIADISQKIVPVPHH